MHYINRNQIHFVLVLLLLSISSTFLYSNIEDPALNTFSMTGNRYDSFNNIMFLLWAIIMSFTTFYVIRRIILFFDDKSHWRLQVLKNISILLVVITLIPASLDMPFLRWTHIVLSGIHTILLVLILHPYVSKVFKGTLLRIPMIIWMILIWIGGIIGYFYYGHNSIYQIWYFINLPIFIGTIYFFHVIKLIRDNENNYGRWTYKNQHFHLTLLLLASLIFTFVYSQFGDPSIYTLSMIGNLLNPVFYMLFVVWGLNISLTIYITLLSLFKATNYNSDKRKLITQAAILLLILNVLIPAQPTYPFWLWVHRIISFCFVVVFSISFHPFIHHIAKHNNKLRATYIIWLLFAWPGSLIILYYYGHTGFYEMWFFINIIVLLISLVFHVNYTKKTSY